MKALHSKFGPLNLLITQSDEGLVVSFYDTNRSIRYEAGDRIPLDREHEAKEILLFRAKAYLQHHKSAESLEEHLEWRSIKRVRILRTSLHSH
jgi:transposase